MISINHFNWLKLENSVKAPLKFGFPQSGLNLPRENSALSFTL
jgi:hypothetical protein